MDDFAIEYYRGGKCSLARRYGARDIAVGNFRIATLDNRFSSGKGLFKPYATNTEVCALDLYVSRF